MKVGDLVRLNEHAERVSVRPESHWDRVGIIVEWDGMGGEHGGWVQWADNADWDIEYEDDLEVISESW